MTIHSPCKCKNMVWNLHNCSLKRWKWSLCTGGTWDTEGLPVSGGVVREKAMTVRARLETMSDVEEGRPFPWWFPRASGGFRGQNMEHPHVSPSSSRRRIRDLGEANIQEVLHKHAAQLCEQIAVSSEPEDEDSCAVSESPQLTTSAVRKCLQLVVVLVHYVFEVDCFMNKCPKYMHKLEAVMASCMEMCEDMRKPAKQSKISSLSLLSLLSPCTLPFSHSDNFRPETYTLFQETPTHIFVPSDHLFIYYRFHVSWYL